MGNERSIACGKQPPQNQDTNIIKHTSDIKVVRPSLIIQKNSQLPENILPSKKCKFVYISPKSFSEEAQYIKDITMTIQQQQNQQEVQQTDIHDNQGPNNDLVKSPSTLQNLCLERQRQIEAARQNGKVVVQWKRFIKVQQKNYLQNYIHIKEIGKGSFGTVFKVRMKHTKLYRAAKVIKIATVNRKKARQEKLVSEIVIMMKTDHPNINKLYQVYQWKKQYVLILDLCEGGDLFNVIKKQRAFAQKRVAQIMKQILSGILYLHKSKIVHRDLKPQNMLYDQQSKTVKLTDFGTAFQISNSKSRMTQFVGSPFYIAPQVIAGNYDEKCDIWSCGVILYIILCGSPPFVGSTQEQILQNIKNQPLAFTNPVWRKRSNECKKLVAYMLRKDPKDRISVVEALNSQWMLSGVQAEDREVGAQIINNLTRFYFKNKLKAVVYTYIASQLYSNKDKQKLMKYFKEIDKDNDGVIQKHELLEVFKTYKGQGFTQQQLQKVMELVDTNQSGHIDFTQFLVAASNQQQLLCQQRLEHAFSYLDTDHSGYITADEIRQFLDDSEETDLQIKKIFDQVDLNGDGKIQKDQFIALLMKNDRDQE